MEIDITAFINYSVGLIGFIATIIAALLVIRSTAVKQTVSEQRDLIEILSKKVAALEASDEEKSGQILQLQSQVDTFKNIPLTQIVQTQEQILETQREIIGLLGSK